METDFTVTNAKKINWIRIIIFIILLAIVYAFRGSIDNGILTFPNILVFWPMYIGLIGGAVGFFIGTAAVMLWVFFIAHLLSKLVRKLINKHE